MTNPNDRRQAVIDGLRELADFLAEHPDVPVGTNAIVDFFPRGTDEEGRAEIDRIAAVLGVTPTANDEGTHYQALRRFGSVTYKAIAITADSMRRWYAERSYSGAVQPDEAVTA